MKKILFRFMAMLVVFSFTVAAFSGCALFTKNTYRDMQQKVATIQISDDVDPINLYKKDLVSGYLSYGYSYVQNNSYTTSQAYSLILNNLIQNSVIIQQSRIEVSKTYKDSLPTAEKLRTALDDLKADKYLSLFASESEISDFENQNGDIVKYSTEYYNALNNYVYDLYKDKTTVDLNDDVFRFIDEVTIYECVANIKVSLNSMVDSFIDDDEDSVSDHESASYSVRTTPTQESDSESDSQKTIDEYKADSLDLADTRITGIADMVDFFKKYGFVSDDVEYTLKDEMTILNLAYFRTSIASSLNSKLVAIYEDGLKADSNIDYTKVTGKDDADIAAKKENIAKDLWSQYQDKVKYQTAQYSNDLTSYKTALGNVSDTSFVVYNPQLGYGYVSHIVIKFSTEQQAIITKVTAENNTKQDVIDAEADKLVKEITVSDQRASWVQSSYGSLDADGNFVFSDDYVKNSYLKNYDGTIGSVTTYTTKNDDKEDVTSFIYNDVTPNTMNYSEFCSLASQVMGLSTTIEYNKVSKLDSYTGNEKQIKTTDLDNFEDLMFAFSDDTGCFNKYFGYAFDPAVDADNGYVDKFESAAREVLASGVGSYEMFGSPEYGLHIILCTATADYGCYSDTDYASFKADLDNEDSVAYKFMKAHVDLVTDNYIQNIAQSFINKYTADEAETAGGIIMVQKFNKVYKDLITDSESDSES